MAWTAGARSIETLRNAGWFTFNVSPAVGGAVVGLTAADNSTAQYETTHGLEFAKGKAWVVEAGARIKALPNLSGNEAFHIVRHLGKVWYCRGTTPTVQAGVPFPMPGAVVHASAKGLAVGVPQYLDAALYAVGDEIVDASLHNVNGSVAISFRPLVARGFEQKFSEVDIQLRPLQLHAGPMPGVRVSFRKMWAVAMEEASNTIGVSMRSMTATATQQPGAPQSWVDVRMKPLAAFASEVAFRQVAISFPTMVAQAFGSGAAKVTMHVELPPFSGYRAANITTETIDETGIGSDLATPSYYLIPTETALASDLQFIEVDAVLTETGRGSDIVVLTDEVVTETGIGTDAVLSPSVEVTITEVAWGGSDALLPSMPGEIEMITETAFGSDDPLPSVISVGLVVDEVARASDGLTFGSTAIVTETGIGTVAPVMGSSFTITERAIGTDVVDASTMSTITSLVLDEVGIGTSGAVMSFSATMTETGIGSDSQTVSMDATLTETGLARDTVLLLGAQAPLLVIDEVGLASDAQEIRTRTNAVIDEVGEAVDAPLASGMGLVAWVLNTDTSGASWYEGWPFTGMAVVRGQVLAIGPEGLALVGADNDDGIEIGARVEHGYTDFSSYGSDGRPANDQWLKQHLVALWVGYRAEGVLDVELQTLGSLPYVYKMAPMPAEQPRNNRMKTGKGPCERFWRANVANVDGCAFKINSMAAEVVPSKQRRL